MALYDLDKEAVFVLTQNGLTTIDFGQGSRMREFDPDGLLNFIIALLRVHALAEEEAAQV